MNFVAKAFVRKYPSGRARGTKQPVTMILMLVEGDVPSLVDEAVHELQVRDIGEVLQVSVCGVEPTEQFRGYRADQILTELLQVNATEPLPHFQRDRIWIMNMALLLYQVCIHHGPQQKKIIVLLMEKYMLAAPI